MPTEVIASHDVEEEVVERIGTILHILKGKVVVQSLPNSMPLDDESLLCFQVSLRARLRPLVIVCLQSRRVLGRVFEVWGRVTSAMYTVRVRTYARLMLAPIGVLCR
jgi:hypothetical protein